MRNLSITCPNFVYYDISTSTGISRVEFVPRYYQRSIKTKPTGSQVTGMNLSSRFLNVLPLKTTGIYGTGIVFRFTLPPTGIQCSGQF
jgi:hypothetical protein